MFRSVLSMLAPCLVFFSAVSTHAEEITLFNGKDLQAWTFDTGSDDQKVKKEDFWIVQNGMLIYRGSLGRGTLRHEGKYETDYVLSLEWRWPTNVASGADIVLHSSDEADQFGRRKEIRVSLNVDEAGDIVYRGTPEQFDTTHERQTDRELEKDFGQWNQLQIICREKMITVVVNGQPVNQVTDAPLAKGGIGVGTAPVPICYRNIKLIRPIAPGHVRAENAAKPLAAAWAKMQARKEAEALKREQARLAAEQKEKERLERLISERGSLIQQIRDAVSSNNKSEASPKLTAKALPYPPDAREIRFNTTFGTIDFKSGSSLKALAAFYLRELTKRGWVENQSKATVEEDSIELVFAGAGGELELELDESSDYVDVSIDTDGVDFGGMNNPAELTALGIPQPRKALLLQENVEIPADAQRLSFDDDGCMFYSTMKLEQAFAHFSNLIKSKGYRESRRPIISKSRNYTEFKRGGAELSVNVFTDSVGSRIILEYDDRKKDPVVAPLPEVALVSARKAVASGASTSGDDTVKEKTSIDVSKNKGTATVTINGEQHVFQHVAAYRTSEDISEGDSIKIAFTKKPIPFRLIQRRLTAEPAFKFMDLSTFESPEYLVVAVGEYSSLQLSVPGTGYFRSLRDPIEGLEVKGGRIRGTLKLPASADLGETKITANADAVIMTPSTSLAPGLTDVAEGEGDFVDVAPPVPDDADDLSRSGTNYRKTYTAESRMSVGETADFYRSDMSARQWRSIAAPSPNANEEVLKFSNAFGTMTVRLRPSGRGTGITIVKRDQQKAKQDGVLPEPGKGRLILANAHSLQVVYSIGRTDYPVKAGAGADNFRDALNYSVGPGNYTVAIKVPGQRSKTERIKITEGSSWAIVAVPTGGYVSMQLY